MSPSTYKALVTQKTEPQSVKVVDVPYPKEIQPEEIVVQIRGVDLNPTDWKHALLSQVGSPGKIVGCDGAGEVVEVGSAVQSFKKGDRVGGFVAGTYYEDRGSFAEYCIFDSALTFKLPDNMSFVEAASLPVAHFTAVLSFYIMWKWDGPSKSTGSSNGENILIYGGSTAVSHHAIQLAKIAGFNVITTASPRNHASLKSLGADVCIDYKDENWPQLAAEAAGTKGFKYIFDGISEKGSIAGCIKATEKTGGAEMITLLGPTPEDKKLAEEAKVNLQLALGYWLQGKEFTLAHVFKFPAMPEMRLSLAKYLTGEFPALVQGWKEGTGSDKLKVAKLNKFEGGLEGIEKGLIYLRDGNANNEKIVYAI